MQILLISDIHANLRGLEAVLAKFGAADQIWCLGDIVEFGPCPLQCVELVRRHCRWVVQGNHDRSFVGAAADGWAQWDRHTVPAEALAYLRGLPATAAATVDGASYLLVHGAPGDPLNGKLTPDTAEDALGAAVQDCCEDRILCAHTHLAMVRDAAGKRVINTGTVGQPRDGDWRAQCMLLEHGQVRFERVAYDLDALEWDYRRSSLPKAVQDEWVQYTRKGIVEAHGLQLGPFSYQTSTTDQPCC